MSKTLLRRLWAVAATLLACVACCWSSAEADVITSSSYKLEIATNLVWLDNRNDPVVKVLNGQQNFFDRMVANANPFMRITNLSDQTRLVGAKLSLEKSSAKIVDCEWVEKPGDASWFWDTDSAHFQFKDPILPGKSVSMRLATAARDDSYTMWQNLFQTGDMPFGQSENYGVVSLLVHESLSRQQIQFDLEGNPIEIAVIDPPLKYDLSTVPRTTYTAIDEYALQTTATIQPVPEPAAYVSVLATLASIAGWRSLRRGRLGRLARG
jgi:hypothetical protein